MAKKFLVPIDLTKNGLFNAALHPSGTAPSTPVEGQIWYDSTNDVLKVYNGTSWLTLADTSSTGVSSVAGTPGEIEVSGTGSGPYTGAVTVGLPNDVSISNNLTVGGALSVTGNLTVSGTTTTVNSETLTVNDNIIVLNNNITGTPTENAGIEIERGTLTNASLIWDEIADKWEAGLAGSEVAIALEGHTHTVSNISDLTATAAELNILDGATLSVAELNVLDGITATTTELNYTDGVTSNIQTQLNSKAASVHTHAISDVTGLQTALDGKASTTHNHTLDSLSNVTITTNTSGEILKWNGTAWINNTLAEAGIAAATHTHAISDVTGLQTALDAKAPLAGPTFTGTVTLPSTTSIGTVSSTEIGYLDGVTSAIQTQLDGKSSTSHNHTLDSLSNVTITANSNGEILRWSGTAWINNTLAEAGIAPAASPTFTGTVTATGATSVALPANTSIGNVSSTELGYLDGVTSAIQTQLGTKTTKYSANVGNGSLTSIAVTHSLGTRDVIVNVYDAASYDTVECDIVRTDTNTVTLGFTTAPASNAYRVVIVG